MSALPPVPGVVNQVTGVVGELDVDDCWVAASIWCAIYADPSAVRPTVREFRAAAGVPDRPGPTGGTLDDVIRGSVRTWPHLTIAKYQSTNWATFEARLSEGWGANLGVLSAELPVYLRFGFLGSHAIGVVKRGEWLVANPLAPDGSRPLPCPLDALRTAAREHGQGYILAALYKPWEASNMRFTIMDGSRSWGVATTSRDTNLYRWDGARIPMGKGTAKSVFGECVVDGKPVWIIRASGGDGHYLIKTHAMFKAADFDEKTRVTLSIGGTVAYTTEA